MTRFSTQGSHSGILWTQKLRSPVENLELARWVCTKNKYVPKRVSLCFEKYTGFKNNNFTLYFVLRWPSVVDGMLKLKNCAGAEDIQGEHDITWQWTASALNTADTEEYRRRMTHWTVHTLNATGSGLTLNAIDSEPHWQLNTRLNTTDTE